MTQALDAAGLALGSYSVSVPTTSQTQLQAYAQSYFNANYDVDHSFGTPAALTVTYDSTAKTAILSSSVAMPTVLVRLGDPEAQVILPLIDEPLLPLLVAAAAGDLRQTTCRLGADRYVGVVIASRGYPESSESGCAIDGIEAAERVPGVSVYHAGTARRDGRLVTAGGRVLTVTARGADFTEAMARAYAGVLMISFDGMQYRRDIGRKAL